MPEQHPIPQQISSYQFRLVGDMTLTQFFQLAGGAVVSLIFYASNLHPIIKWPAVIFFALLGVAIAFLPIEERSLDKWFISFIKAIYSPTLFYWKSEPDKAFFSKDTGQTPPMTAPHGIKKAEEYLQKPVQDSEQEQFLDSAETQYLAGIKNQLTSPQPVHRGATQSSEGIQPMPVAQGQQQAMQVGNQTHVVSVDRPLQQAQTPQTPAPTQSGVINIPKMEHVRVVPPPNTTSPPPQEPVEKSSAGPVYSAQAQKVLDSAQFSEEVAPPMPPEKPNTIVGQVFDESKKIVESAILEMRDKNGRPVRALRSNKLGHFLVVTPLADGTYQILTEKQGFEFKPVSIEMKGEIVPPVAINGKRVKS